ncbi:hypothetical protein GCM10012275_60370 [Longimycelium tulufanense]|uniref:CU044_5270 family protein n=1 Tax=Longimycelium tulufanense TaxID=907463 RepID=A0A8J3CK38_9PSEU|nr:hypothetical protein GCM10012275_60370 [Longimycelium tulufanense]
MAAAVAVVAVGAVAAGFSFFRTPPVAASVPPLLTFQADGDTDARSLLTGLAERAGQQPGLGAGRFHYSRTRSWTFGTAAGTDGGTLAARVAETRLERWTAPDGSGFEKRHQDSVRPGGPPLVYEGPFPTPEVQPTVGPQNTVVSALPPVGEADAGEIERRLRADGVSRTAGEWFAVTAQVWSARSGDPATAQALARILADQSGITVAGTTTDRAGRPAVAIATRASGDQWFPKQRVYLLFDPATGFLTGAEDVALQADTDAIGAPVEVPATVRYQLWLGSGRTDTSGETPR